LALSSIATVSAAETPSPKPPDLKKPVKIYLLSGQSNMTGRGNLGDLTLKTPAAHQKASLVRFIMEPQNVEKYKFLYKEDARKNRAWTVRDDVFITMGDWPHSEGRAEKIPLRGSGGIHGGITHGATDEFDWHSVQNKVHVQDLHATILHLMGFDHEKRTCRHAGRDYRLTDVYGQAVREILR